jgi:hypothetical protein
MSKIQTAINAAMRDIAKIGIGKTQTNTAQNYRFRGVEQAMNELSPIMVNNGITVAARYSELAVAERIKGAPADGKATRFVTLKGTFTFTADDDSSMVADAYGEAMDSGDKAVIKAQSVAFRTAIFQTFVVPTMSMDTELDHGEDEGDDGAAASAALLEQFREVALQGPAALKAHFERVHPPAAFWSRHSASLKEAATAAEKGARQ